MDSKSEQPRAQLVVSALGVFERHHIVDIDVGEQVAASASGMMILAQGIRGFFPAMQR